MLLALSLTTCLSPFALANPTGGTVTAGAATITSTGSEVDINQTTDRAVINWGSFNIGSNETTQFIQPGTNSLTLNRVTTSGQVSTINGNLIANGHVLIINPNGVLIGSKGNVDVAGFVASSADIDDNTFMTASGAMQFDKAGKASAVVENRGHITISDAGLSLLVAPEVRNNGIIEGNLARLQMGAGDTFGVDFYGDGLLNLAVSTSGAKRMLTAENAGSLIANGGKVLMTAAAASDVVNSVINTTGVIQARTLVNHGGEIILTAPGTSVTVDGTLDASAPDGGDGGFIETSGEHLTVANTAHITTNASAGQTGQWLIDPNDYKIAASGSDITGATLSASLGSTNVTILSSTGATAGNGDIFVNDAVSWSANNTLTLSAYRNINVNANITATGNTAGLTLTPNTGAGGGSYSLNNGAVITLSGSTPSLNIAGNSYTVINSLTALQNMNSNLSGYYALGSNIDASATSAWNSGAGFVPVGSDITPFTGKFDGLNHTISNIFIYRPAQWFQGLFGYVSNTGVIKNVGVQGGSVRGYVSVGPLVGRSYGTITNSYSTASAEGILAVGGLAGQNMGSISYSYATGNVTGHGGSSIGADSVGGLVGENGGGSVNQSYATGAVTAAWSVAGGLVGNNNAGSYIGNSYSTGSVTSLYDSGGLVGENYAATIVNSYATGLVWGASTPSAHLGGLVGRNLHISSSITNSYWNTETTGMAIGVGVSEYPGWSATGLTTAQMKQQSSFTGFDFSNIWRIYEGQTYPLLRALLKPLTITADNVTKTYDATSVGLTNVTYSDSAASGSANLFGISTPYGSVTKNNVGTYSANIWSGQQGYDITLVGGQLTVTPASLTISATGVNKVYDSTMGAAVTLSDNRFAGDAITASYTSASFVDKSAGNGKAVSVTGIGISGTDAGNYTFNTTASATADITSFALTIGAAGVNKVYDATTGATVTLSDNRFAGDVFTDGYTSANFATKNVGTGKTVSVGGISISGADAGNYTFNTTASTSANITPFALTIGATGVNRVYDATTGATVTLSDNRFSGDVLTTDYTASFANKNVGTGKAVSVSGITLGGTDAGNYTFNTTATATANITPFALTIGATGVNKVYDATTNAAVTLSDNRFSGDALTTGYTSASFGDKNVGAGKTVSVSGITLGGTDAGNYTFNTTASTTANITARALTLAGTPIAADKVYDGTATASISGATLGGVQGLDVVSLGGLFADKNAGRNKTVTLTLNGFDAGNYSLPAFLGILRASISKAALVITATGQDKVYDGVKTATVVYGDDRIAGDSFVITGNANFRDRNVGAGKEVNVRGIRLIGTDAGNYAFNKSVDTTASILVRSITVTADNKTMLFGGVIPRLTYTVGGLGMAGNEPPSRVFTGTLVTVLPADATVGTHAITQGTLTPNGNYVITTFTNGVLTVQ